MGIDIISVFNPPKKLNPGRQEEIKGCSGECDFCPDADDCEQCGSI